MKQEFYESKDLLLCMILLCVFIGCGMLYFAQTVCANLLLAVLVPLWAILFLGRRYFLASKPYVTIDNFKIEHDGQMFLWTQIKSISLTRRRGLRSRRTNFFLKIEQEKAVSWIDLKYFSDKNRRALLDALELYIPVQYDSCSYESNEQRWFMFWMFFLVAFAMSAYWFHNFIVALGK